MAITFDEYSNIKARLLGGGRLIFPDIFKEELSYMEQLVLLWECKQNLLKAGDNITLTENEDGTVTISAGQGGETDTYSIENVTPSSGNSRAYALINVATGQQSGETIEIPTAIKGDKGETGETGNGIDQIVFVEQTQAGNTYRIDMTDGTSYEILCPRGNQGEAGQNGEDGVDGFSPIAEVTQIAGGAVITVTDANGTTTATINNGSAGAPGAPGADGVTPDITLNVSVGSNTGTPTATVQKTGTSELPVYTITFDGLKGEQGVPGSGQSGVGITSITFKESTAAGNTYTILLDNGQTYDFTAPIGPQGVQGNPGIQGNPGNDGSDGFSPIAVVTQTQNGATISITDANGQTTATISNGSNGAAGVGITSITFKNTDVNGNNIYSVNLSDSTSYDITCPKGSAGVPGSAGAPGQNGSDGVDGDFWWTTYADYTSPNYTFAISALTGASGATPKVDDFVLQNYDNHTKIYRITSVDTTTVLTSYVCDITGASGSGGGLTVDEYRFANMMSPTPSSSAVVTAYPFSYSDPSVVVASGSDVATKVHSRVSVLELTLSGFKSAKLATNDSYNNNMFAITFTASASASDYKYIVIVANYYTPQQLFFNEVGPDHSIYVTDIPVSIIDNNATNYLGLMTMNIAPDRGGSGNYELNYVIKTDMPITSGHSYVVRIDSI